MGSLFQLRDYWYTSFPNEEFSPSAVVVGDLDNLDTCDKVALGSFQGYLRILLPGCARGELQPVEVLFEKKYEEPILQLACGRFQPIVGGVSRNLLAVLFPRRLTLLSVERVGEQAASSSESGATDTGTLGTCYRCTQQFEVQLEHSAYNMTYGPLGRTNYDLICVQSMDGQLTVVDHNKVLYRRFLPSDQFLVPGCLAYCAQRDSLITNNSSLFVMCYSFSTVANSIGSERKDKADADPSDGAAPVSASGGSSGGRITPDWAFNIGDDAVGIQVCRLTRGLPRHERNIVVLCPYTLFVLSLEGQCMFTKRMDVEMCSLSSYPMQDIYAENLLIGAYNGSLYVYSDVALEWSAKMRSGCPIATHVALLCGTEGMILALSSEGVLSVNYLGTDPADKPIQPLESQKLSHADMTQELKVVQQSIRKLLEEGEEEAAARASATPSAFPSGAGAREGGVSPVTHPSTLSGDPAPHPSSAPVAGAAAQAGVRPVEPFALSVRFAAAEGDGTGTVIVPLILELERPFRHMEVLVDVVVQVQCVEPVHVEPMHQVVPRIGVGESVTVPLRVSAAPDKDHIVPSSLELSAVVIFTGKRYDTWAVRRTAHMPFSLVARPVPPVKNTSFTLQLNTDKSPPPSLVDLFGDLVAFGNVTSNVLSIHYLNGADATVLVSKNAARFKLQGSTIEGLWLLTSELTRRLRRYYAADGELHFSITEDVPLADFCAVIDTHAAIRKELVNATAGLDRAAQLFRSVEMRLLVRFRDRNPSSSSAITVLFEESYASLQRAADAVVLAQARQRQACAMLNCCARLFFFWMRIRYPGSFEKMAVAKPAPHHSSSGKGTIGGPSSDGAPAAATTEDLLQHLFTCDISADDGIGWEEVTEAALVQLLDIKARKVASKTLEVSLNTANVKKYFTQLVEHIKAGKGF